jgi:hypothetical protein
VVTDARWDCSEDEINQAHYGASFLWTLYLAENFGDRSGDPNRSSFLRDLVADSRTGLGGIDATLASHGFLETSEDVFKRWVVANYIGIEGRGPPFGYEGIKLTRYPEVAGRVDFTRQAGAVYTFPEVDLQPWSTAYYEVRAGILAPSRAQMTEISGWRRLSTRRGGGHHRLTPPRPGKICPDGCGEAEQPDRRGFCGGVTGGSHTRATGIC